MGIVEIDKLIAKEMTKICKAAYLGRLRLIRKSNLNGSNKIEAGRFHSLDMQQGGNRMGK